MGFRICEKISDLQGLNFSDMKNLQNGECGIMVVTRRQLLPPPGVSPKNFLQLSDDFSNWLTYAPDKLFYSDFNEVTERIRHNYREEDDPYLKTFFDALDKMPEDKRGQLFLRFTTELLELKTVDRKILVPIPEFSDSLEKTENA